MSAAAQSAAPARFPTPLAEDAMPAVASLPAVYPSSWLVVHGLNFNSLVDGRAALLDVAAPARNLKGHVPVAQLGNILAASTRPELYVAETFYARLTRGARTDVVTRWDCATLAPTGEIVLPGAKRGLFVTHKYAFQFTNEERWALVFNFTPASSVTVVDLVGQTVLGEIDLPGASLIYPTGPRGFSALAADGTMVSIALDARGAASAAVASTAFNDLDADPLHMTPAMIGRTAWFVSYRGHLRGIDLAADRARDLGSFPLPPQPGGDPEWRPSGWQVISADGRGHLHVLMSRNGREGSHKDGGTEVWTIDPVRRALVGRHRLAALAASIEATHEDRPTLVAARHDGQLDLYDAGNGTFRRTLESVVPDPLTMTAIRR